MIEFSHTSFRYGTSESLALQDVSFQVSPGELVVVTGRSGCGKSTLINRVNGLLPKHPGDAETGRVRICGRESLAIPGYEIASLVGSVFQNPKSQFFNLDTDSEIAFGLENAGVPNPTLRNRVTETIAQVGIEDLSGRGIFELSGGQKQRVAIAGAYALQPLIYVLDEPSANLDPRSTAKLAHLLTMLKSQGAALLVSEHRLGYLSKIADRYIVLDAGQVRGNYSNTEFEALSIQDRHSLGVRALTLQEATARQRGVPLTLGSPIAQAHNITMAYPGRPLLDQVSFSLNAGEVVGLVGENGAGKTTLARLMCGLQKPDGGKMLLDGKPIRARRSRAATFMIMQDVNSQLFGETVEEECTIGLRVVDLERVSSVLEQLNLKEFRRRHPLSLSGGQKQRAAVASGLCSDCKLLIFDEPTSGLDRESMLATSYLIQEIAAEGRAVLVISHDVEFLATVCSRIEELRNGKLVPHPEGANDVSARLREFFGRGLGMPSSL